MSSPAFNPTRVRHAVGEDPLTVHYDAHHKRVAAAQASKRALEEEEEAIENARLAGIERKKQIALEKVQKQRELIALSTEKQDLETEKRLILDEREQVLDIVAHFMSTQTLEQRREFCSIIASEYDPLWTAEYWLRAAEQCAGVEEESTVLLPAHAPPKKPVKKVLPGDQQLLPSPKPKSIFEQWFCTSMSKEELDAMNRQAAAAAAASADEPEQQHPKRHEELVVRLSRITVEQEQRTTKLAEAVGLPVEPASPDKSFRAKKASASVGSP